MRIFPAMLTAAVAASFFTSCDNSPYEGYDKTESGLYYKFYEENESGRKPAEGEFANIYLSYRTESDSVLFDSQKYKQNPDGTVDFSVMKPTFQGSFEEALTMMHEGDSASFKVSADSIYLKSMGAGELPPFIKPGSMLTFEVKMVKVKSKEEMEKQFKAMQEKEMEEYRKMVEERKSAEGTEMQDYLTKNNITLKPTESGLYYIEQKKGTGPKVKVGDQVTVDYVLYSLDGTQLDGNKGITFGLEPGKMIPGFIEGVTKMNVGGKATLLLPSAIAYGEMGNEGIPPYTPLLFEVEVKDTKPGNAGNAPGTNK